MAENETSDVTQERNIRPEVGDWIVTMGYGHLEARKVVEVKPKTALASRCAVLTPFSKAALYSFLAVQWGVLAIGFIVR